MYGKKVSLIPAYKIFDKEDKFQEPYISTTLNHFRNNNTHLPLNSNNINPLIHKPYLQPSLHPVKAQKEHSNNSTIIETTATTKHSNDPDDTNISGITCFSSTNSDTKNNPNNNIAFKGYSRTKTKEKKNLNINEEIIEFRDLANLILCQIHQNYYPKFLVTNLLQNNSINIASL